MRKSEFTWCNVILCVPDTVKLGVELGWVAGAKCCEGQLQVQVIKTIYAESLLPSSGLVYKTSAFLRLGFQHPTKWEKRTFDTLLT